MNKIVEIDKFLEWHNNALRDYIEKQWPNREDAHIFDLVVAAASFTEAFYLIVEHMPD